MERWAETLLLLVFLAFRPSRRALAQTATSSNQKDIETMLQFRATFSNGAAVLDNWAGDDPCTWTGISCDSKGAVTKM
jgi:hypothetical protein